MLGQFKQTFPNQEIKLSLGLKNWIKIDVGLVKSTIMSGIIVFGCMVNPASAGVRHEHTHKQSVADTLNEQQLQNLASDPVPVPCEAVLPRTLSAPIQSRQIVVVTSHTDACNSYVTAPPPPVGWTLYAGQLVGKQIVNWGRSAGWRVIWRCHQDWVVPSSAEFHGDFTVVSSQVLEDLAAEGASIHGEFYQGNHTLVITGANQ